MPVPPTIRLPSYSSAGTGGERFGVEGVVVSESGVWGVGIWRLAGVGLGVGVGL